MSLDLGVYKIQCANPSGCTLANYGQFSFSDGYEIDLMDQTLPETIRCGDWYTADNMCRDTGFEMAQLIQSGDLIVTERTPPDISSFLNN